MKTDPKNSSWTKKIFLLFILPALFSFADTLASPLPGSKGGPLIKKEHAKRVIRRTAVVVRAAHQKVKEGHVYTGNLAHAIAHQKFARELYRNGKYFRAIHHSRRARSLAVLAIKANKGAESTDMRFSKEEEESMKGGPSDNELDNELSKEMQGESMKDQDVTGSEPDIDLREDE